jgi:hypothetical protein
MIYEVARTAPRQTKLMNRLPERLDPEEGFGKSSSVSSLLPSSPATSIFRYRHRLSGRESRSKTRQARNFLLPRLVSGDPRFNQWQAEGDASFVQDIMLDMYFI